MIIICESCHKTTSSLNKIQDCHGNVFALVGDCCKKIIDEKRRQFSIKYGAYFIDGVQVASPKGSPVLDCLERLNEEIA